MRITSRQLVYHETFLMDFSILLCLKKSSFVTYDSLLSKQVNIQNSNTIKNLKQFTIFIIGIMNEDLNLRHHDFKSCALATELV